jgi:hypothetical protein
MIEGSPLGIDGVVVVVGVMDVMDGVIRPPDGAGLAPPLCPATAPLPAAGRCAADPGPRCCVDCSAAEQAAAASAHAITNQALESRLGFSKARRRPDRHFDVKIIRFLFVSLLAAPRSAQRPYTYWRGTIHSSENAVFFVTTVTEGLGDALFRTELALPALPWPVLHCRFVLHCLTV